jgi:RNA polymerase sigma-70 factor (ECF subfamily)
MRRRRHHVPLESAAEASRESADPEQSAASAQHYRMVLSVLRELSPREREALVLRDLEGRTTKEVAEILGTSEGTVRSHLSTGRTKIKNYVAARLRRRS